MELRHIAKRTAVVGSTSIVVGGVVLYGILIYQDWARAQRINNLDGSTPPPALNSDNPPSPKSFAPMQVVPQMPAITQINTVTADEIQDEVEDDDLILGVEIDGKARAYSINMLTGPSREIFNDEFAGQPIAATW